MIISKAENKREKGFIPLVALLVVAAVSGLVVGGSVVVDKLQEKDKEIAINVDKAIKESPLYLDKNKIKNAKIETFTIGTVLLPDGSFSAYRVEEAEVSSQKYSNATNYAGETKISFLSGDVGLGNYSGKIISPFFLKDGTKADAIIIDRLVAKLVLESGQSLPLKILRGKVENGKLKGVFYAQTYSSGYLIIGQVNGDGNVITASVTLGLDKATEAQTIIARKALDLYKEIASSKTPYISKGESEISLDSNEITQNITKDVLGIESGSDNDSFDPYYDSKKGVWSFGGAVVSPTTSQGSNILNYVSQTLPLQITQIVKEQIQTVNTTRIEGGISNIESNSTRLSVSTENAVSDLSLDLTELTEANLANSAVTSAKIKDGEVKEADIADGAVTSAKIVDNTIATADIADGAVTSSKIANETITTADLASALTFGDDEFIDLAAITHNDNGLQGLRLPNVSSASPTSPSSGEGFIAYDTSGNQVIAYNGSSWAVVGGAGSGITTIQENDTTIISSATTIDFLGSDFLVGGGSGEGDISIDYTSSGITRKGQVETVTGGWTFNTASTIFTTAIDVNTASTIAGLTVDGGSLTLSGLTTDITTGTNEVLTITPNGTGNVLINPNAGGQAALIINKQGANDIFSASSSGTNRFSIQTDGKLLASFYQTCTLKTDSTGLVTCGTDNTGSSTSPFAEITGGVIVPNNSTVDFLIGGQSSAAAKFAVTGVAAGAPVATLSASTNGNGVVLSASDARIQSLRNNTLTLGGDTTGNITLSPLNGGAGSLLTVNAVTTSLTGALSVTGASDLQGNVSDSGGNLILDDTVDLGSATTGLRVDTSGNVIDIDGNIVLADIVDLGSATTGINISAAGLITDSDGNVIIGDTLDLGSATTGVNVTTAGALSDSDANLVLNDQTDIGSATTGIRITTAGSISDIDGTLQLNDAVDITGTLSDSDSNLTLSDSVDITGSTLTLNNAGALLTTGTDQNLTITPNGSGDLILSSDFDSAVLVGSSANTPAVLSVSGGIGSNASLIVNNLNSGDLIAASASGVTKFTLSNAGALSLTGGQTSDIDTLTATTLKIGATTANALTLGNNTVSTLTFNVDTAGNFVFQKEGSVYSCSGTDKLTLNGSGQLVCGTDQTGGAGTSPFAEITGGVIVPNNSTVDFLIGGQSSAAAKFAVTGVAAGAPVATLSASTNGNGVVLSASDARIQSLRNNTLTLGGDTTGNITLSPLNGGAGSLLTVNAVTTSLTGALSVTGASDLQGNVSDSGGNLILDDTVDLGSATTGLRVDTSGNVIDIDGNIVLADIVDLGSATTGINISAAGLITDSDGNVIIGDTLDLGSATTGVNVTTAGALSDSDANLVLNDQTDIGSATTGIRITTAGSISDIDGTLQLNDALDITGDITFSATAPTITINAAETFQIANGTAADNLTYNTSTNNLTIGDATNFFTWDLDTGPDYGGSARPTKTITLSPEYAGAILTASGSGTFNGSMTSDASNSATLDADKFKTYYEWTSTQASLQDYTVALRVTLPADFSGWPSSATTMQVNFNTASTVNTTNKLDVFVYNPSTSTSTPVVYRQAQVSGTGKTWTTVNIADTDLTDSPAWNTAGQTAIIYLKLYGSGTYNYTQVGDIVLNYKSKF